MTLEVVQKEYDRLVPRFAAFCGCDMCRGDVLVFALNRLQPHYVSTRQGEVITELNLEADQEKARFDVVLMEGLRVVSLSPRCGARPVQLA